MGNTDVCHVHEVDEDFQYEEDEEYSVCSECSDALKGERD